MSLMKRNAQCLNLKAQAELYQLKERQTKSWVVQTEGEKKNIGPALIPLSSITFSLLISLWLTGDNTVTV